MNVSIHSKVAILAGVLLIVGACAQAKQAGEDTPQAVLAAAHQAAADHDAVAIMRLVAPSQIPMMAFEADMAADFLVGFSAMGEDADPAATAKLTQGVTELREKYNFYPKMDGAVASPEQHAREYCKDVDCSGYVEELGQLLFAHMPPDEKPLFPPGEVGEITQDGDRASTMVGTREVVLVREEGRWYLAEPPR